MVATATRMETLRGTISHITFQAEDTGYCVFRLDIDEKFKSVTAVGVMPDISRDSQVEISGGWRKHPKFGEQFAFENYVFPEPDDREGLIAFLQTLKGCGPSMAKRIWDLFGEETIEVMNESPHMLKEVQGVGEKTFEALIESYAKSRELRKLIAFLHKLGVSATYANRIFKRYGGSAIHEIKMDPYILAEQVKGFGFKKADEVARNMGIAEDSFVRTKAAILFSLKEAANRDGHCYLRMDKLGTIACELLTLPGYRPQSSLIAEAVPKMLPQVKVVEGDRVYLFEVLRQERRLCKNIQGLAGDLPFSPLNQGSPKIKKGGLFDALGIDPEKDSEQVIDARSKTLDEFVAAFEQKNFSLAKGQRQAIRMAASNGFSIVTGGAGVGKSTVSKAILELWHQQGKRVVAAAPTGKAALRIYEATGVKASTIHRLLGWNGKGFERGPDNPLSGDAFLIDESSMVNLRLFDALVAAIPVNAVVVLVGDVNQLPAIGAGNVLLDLIESGAIPVTRLDEVFRQGEGSRIISHCQSILNGQVPQFEYLAKDMTTQPITDCLFLPCDREKIPVALNWLVTKRLPTMGWAQDDIQVLSPMHKGDYGNIVFNQLIQQAWNPRKTGEKDVKGMRVGDRIIQLRNDYDKKVFNGDIAKIEAMDLSEQELSSRFDDIDNPLGRVVKHSFPDVEDLGLAYSLSIHKSQGSEFPVVVLPATMSHYMMLQRNLLYTGMSRGKKLVVLVGEEKAIAQAVRTVKAIRRNTGLQELLLLRR